MMVAHNSLDLDGLMGGKQQGIMYSVFQFILFISFSPTGANRMNYITSLQFPSCCNGTRANCHETDTIVSS